MSFFAFFLLCLQACLIQNVYSKCIGSYAASLAPAATLTAPITTGEALGLISAPFAASVTAPLSEPFLVLAAADHIGAYGGAGIGEVAVAGELPAVGTTLVAGQVPVLGAVKFGGPVCAAGTVSIGGSCACGCTGPFGAGPFGPGFYGPGYIY